MIIGWVLVNNSVDNPVLQFSKAKVEFFKTRKIIPENSKVGLALQICVDREYQGMGIIQKAYSYFETMLKNKYDIIEASVRINNPAGNGATTKIGMTTIFEDDLRIYKVKETASHEINEQEKIKVNDKSILIRFGKVGDEKQLYELNLKWIITDTANNNLKGFLTSLYQPEEFRKIIECNDIVADLYGG